MTAFSAVLLFLLQLASAPQDSISMPMLQGWHATLDGPMYQPSNLWDAIDGAADLFLEYNFVELRNYLYTSGGGGEIRVEVYRHGSPEDAFGMYAQERAPDYTFIPIGAEGYKSAGVLNFLCGSHYVKLSSNDTLLAPAATLHELARRIAGTIDASCSLPRELSRLPAVGKVSHTEQFVRKGFLGYPFLQSVYVARYQPDIRLFIIDALTAEQGRVSVAALCRAIGDHRTPEENHWLSLNDPHNGKMDLLVRGRWIGGVLDWTNEEARKTYRASLAKSLQRLLR